MLLITKYTKTKEIKKRIKNHLIKHYHDLGNKNYFFKSKFIARELQITDVRIVGRICSELSKEGILKHWNHHHAPSVWHTCF